jgi:hypothetical protein
MGKRDIQKREMKKPKKGARKSITPIALQPTRDVEVVPRGKRSRDTEEEE